MQHQTPQYIMQGQPCSSFPLCKRSNHPVRSDLTGFFSLSFSGPSSSKDPPPRCVRAAPIAQARRWSVSGYVRACGLGCKLRAANCKLVTPETRFGVETLAASTLHAPVVRICTTFESRPALLLQLGFSPTPRLREGIQDRFQPSLFLLSPLAVTSARPRPLASRSEPTEPTQEVHGGDLT